MKAKYHSKHKENKYETYRTENADKVRAMIGAGAWGSGKPDIDLRKDNEEKNVY